MNQFRLGTGARVRVADSFIFYDRGVPLPIQGSYAI